jgi:hypothetical protein
VDPNYLQAVAERDQLWASLRPLMPEIERLACGEWTDSPRERQLVQLLSRIVVAEMRFRAENPEAENP